MDHWTNSSYIQPECIYIFFYTLWHSTDFDDLWWQNHKCAAADSAFAKNSGSFSPKRWDFRCHYFIQPSHETFWVPYIYYILSILCEFTEFNGKIIIFHILAKWGRYRLKTASAAWPSRINARRQCSLLVAPGWVAYWYDIECHALNWMVVPQYLWVVRQSMAILACKLQY